MVTFNARFDGKVIVPDEPLDLPPNQPLIVQIQAVEAPENKEGALDWLAANAIETDTLPEDLSVHHDHYLYGRPKVRVDE